MDNRIITKLLIKEAPICKECPAKLYQKEDSVIKYGKGMYIPNIMFIFPPYIFHNKEINEYLKLICEDIINLDEQYITSHPKCISGLAQEVSINYCRHYLLHEITKINPNKIIFFGVDIPEELYKVIPCIKLYKFNSLYTIKYGSKTIQYFKEQLKQII